MPRRNKRPEHEVLVLAPSSIEVPPRPLTEDEEREQYEARHDRRVKEHRRREDDMLLRLKRCVYPECTLTPVRSPEPLALCANHAITTWGKVDAWNDRKPLSHFKLNRELEAAYGLKRQDAERESRSLVPGWIYYIRVTDRIKIGYSTDVRNRMRAYPPHSELLAVHPGTPTLEREMHAQFVGLLAQGREWFREGDDLMAHIARVVEDFGPPPKGMVYKFREGTTQRIKPRARH